jgi:hypothetical protein
LQRGLTLASTPALALALLPSGLDSVSFLLGFANTDRKESFVGIIAYFGDWMMRLFRLDIATLAGKRFICA